MLCQFGSQLLRFVSKQGLESRMSIIHLDDEPVGTLHPLDLLERAVEAMRMLENRQVVGKVVITMD